MMSCGTLLRMSATYPCELILRWMEVVTLPEHVHAPRRVSESVGKPQRARPAGAMPALIAFVALP
jgi:hypothetical protein